MKRLVGISLAIFAGTLSGVAGAVYINEVVPNAPGADGGNEYFELRGTPNLSLAGYYLLSVEGEGGTGRGDINQYFDLSAFSLGANGYLFARQAGSQYTATDPGCNVAANSIGASWGQANAGGVGSSVGHYSDSTQVDIENGCTTIMLITIGSGLVPTNTMDLDTNNDGYLDLPAEWTVVDSIGIMDGASGGGPTNYSYGLITFRAPGGTGGAYWGTNLQGNVIDIPGPLTTTAGTFYVGRKGESTGSTSNDWVGAIVDGVAAAPLNFFMFSSSDSAYTGMLLSDMSYGGTNASIPPLGTLPYTPVIHTSRFTNFTEKSLGGPIGDVAVDPRDNTTILFAVDNDVGGAIYRAYKVASGNWWVDSAPVVSGLDRPSGLVVQDDGTLWWVHDVTRSLRRLKYPWVSNTMETVVSEFGTLGTDDDPADLAFTPGNFTGSVGQPNWIVVADKGSDSDAFNAVNLQDPSTTQLNQTNMTFVVSPTSGGLGFDDLTAITGLPASGEIVTLSKSTLTAIDGNGTTRIITPTTLAPTNALGLALDPTTGRLWVAEDGRDEIWSIDPSASGQTPDVKELSFPLIDPTKSYRQIRFHDPCLAFATNGNFLVVSDSSMSGGGGRLIIFHSEAYAPFALSSFSITNVAAVPQGLQLQWSPAGSESFNLKYDVQRTAALEPTAFQVIATVTSLTFTDTNAPAGGSFYRVLAKP